MSSDLEYWWHWPSTGHPERIDDAQWTILGSGGQRMLGLPYTGLFHYPSQNFSSPFGIFFFGSIPRLPPDYTPLSLQSIPWLSLHLCGCAVRELGSFLALTSFYLLIPVPILSPRLVTSYPLLPIFTAIFLVQTTIICPRFNSFQIHFLLSTIASSAVLFSKHN